MPKADIAILLALAAALVSALGDGGLTALRALTEELAAGVRQRAAAS